MALNLARLCGRLAPCARFSALIFRQGFLGDIRSREGADFESLGIGGFQRGGLRPTEIGDKRPIA
jgi:hypothetical protein